VFRSVCCDKVIILSSIVTGVGLETGGEIERERERRRASENEEKRGGGPGTSKAITVSL
jgi:hypothetical protein